MQADPATVSFTDDDFAFLDRQQAALAGAKARTAPADPDAYAKARELSAATGVPVGVAARNVDQVRQIKQAQDLHSLAAAHPPAGRWMAAGDNAALAHDDTPTLGKIANAATAINRVPQGHWGGDVRAPVWIPGPPPVEKWLGAWIIDAFRAPTEPGKRVVGTAESIGRMGAQGIEELTSLLSKMAVVPAGVADSLAGLFQSGAREHPQDALYRGLVDPQEALVHALAIDPTTEQQSAGADVSGKVAHAVPGLAAAVATGGGAEAIPLKEGGSVALNWLRNALLKAAYASPGVAIPAGAQKFDAATQAGDSTALAAAKDAGTMVETTAAMAIPLAGKTKAGSAALGAVGMPAIQTVLSWLHGEGTPGERELVANSIIGALTGAVFGGSEHPAAKITAAEHNAKALDAVMQAASESRLGRRSPEHLADFVANVGEHTVYVPEAAVNDHYAAKGLDPAVEVAKIAGNPDAYLEAEGGLLRIPLADYVTKGQQLHKAIGDTVKLDPEGISPAGIPDAIQAQQEAAGAALEPGATTVSTKDASMQAARVARGESLLDTIQMPEHKQEVVDAQKRMADNPNLAEEIVARKLAGDRSIAAADEAVLQVHAVDLTAQMEAQAARASDPLATPEARTAARLKGEELAARFNDLNQATKITGAAWSHFGRQRMRELLDDYSFAALVRKETTRLERPLNAAETAKLKAQADKIVELEAAAARHAEALAEATGKRKPAGPKKSVDERAQERLRADIAKLEATITERLKACPV